MVLFAILLAGAVQQISRGEFGNLAVTLSPGGNTTMIWPVCDQILFCRCLGIFCEPMIVVVLGMFVLIFMSLGRYPSLPSMFFLHPLSQIDDAKLFGFVVGR